MLLDTYPYPYRVQGGKVGSGFERLPKDRIGQVLSKVKSFPKLACLAASWQTLPNATSPTGKIHKFSKTAVCFEPVEQL